MSVCVCGCVCVDNNSRHNGSIHFKLEHIEYENSSDEFDIGHCQSQGHSMTFKFFTIYHNTACQVLYISFGTYKEDVIKSVC